MEGPSSDSTDAAAAEPAGLEIELRPPRLLHVPATQALAGAALCILLLVAAAAGMEGIGATTLVLGAAGLLALLAALLGIVAARLRRQRPRILLRDHQIVLPRYDGGRGTRGVAIDGIRAIGTCKRRGGDVLYVDTSFRSCLFPVAAFADPGTASSLIGAVRSRVAELQDGAERLALFDQREHVFAPIFSRRPWMTWAMAVVNLLFFGVEIALSALTRPTAMLHLGANVAPLSLGPEPGRLLAANFLHMNIPHLVVNMLLLLVVGPHVEKIVGPAAFAGIFLVAGAAGSLTSAILRPEHVLMSVGASGCVLGCICAWAVLGLRYDQELPSGIRRSRRWWSFLGLLAVADFIAGSLTNVDLWAHAGGMVVGAALTLAVISPRRPCVDVLAGTRGANVAAAVLLAVHAGVLAGTVAGAMTNASAKNAVTLERLVRAGFDGVEVVNNLAWRVAEDGAATRTHVAMARDAATATHEGDPKNPHLTDTMATLAFRLGEVERAIALESGLPNDTLEADFYLTQLSRFLRARPAGAKALVLPRGARPGAPIATVAEVVGGEVELRVSSAEAVNGPLRVVMVAVGDEGLAGAVEAVLPRLQSGTGASLRGALPAIWVSEELRFEPGLVDLRGLVGVATGAGKIRIVPANPEAMALPGPSQR
jgi:membrane associated rhomboid family serine protease